MLNIVPDRPLNVAWAVPKFKYGENIEQDAPRKKINSTLFDDDNVITVKGKIIRINLNGC